MLLIGLLVSAYVLFVFVGEKYNPFILPSGRIKRVRLRLGRYVSGLHLFSAVIAYAIGKIWLLSFGASLAIYVVLALIGLGILAITKGFSMWSSATTDVRLQSDTKISAVKVGDVKAVESVDTTTKIGYQDNTQTTRVEPGRRVQRADTTANPVDISL